MSRRLVRLSAQVLGGLLALLIVWRFRPSSLLGRLALCIFVAQALALYVVLGFDWRVTSMPLDDPDGKSEVYHDAPNRVCPSPEEYNHEDAAARFMPSNGEAGRSTSSIMAVESTGRIEGRSAAGPGRKTRFERRPGERK